METISGDSSPLHKSPKTSFNPIFSLVPCVTYPIDLHLLFLKNNKSMQKLDGPKGTCFIENCCLYFYSLSSLFLSCLYLVQCTPLPRAWKAPLCVKREPLGEGLLDVNQA